MNDLDQRQLEDRRLLATLTVMNLNDSGPESLRAAITQANGSSRMDQIEFAAGLSGSINLNSQLPTITESLSIIGTGQTLLTLDAGDGVDSAFATGDGFRIFDIDDDDHGNLIAVSLSGLQLSGGDTANGIDGSAADDSTAGEDGGAIRSSENLTLIDSTLSGNTTGDGGKMEAESDTDMPTVESAGRAVASQAAAM